MHFYKFHFAQRTASGACHFDLGAVLQGFIRLSGPIRTAADDVNVRPGLLLDNAHRGSGPCLPCTYLSGWSSLHWTGLHFQICWKLMTSLPGSLKFLHSRIIRTSCTSASLLPGDAAFLSCRGAHFAALLGACALGGMHHLLWSASASQLSAVGDTLV